MNSTQPLKGYKVLDMTTFLSGPYCTQILGDLGAEVLKVESPAGDSSRHIPPYFVENDSAYFLANNRNKKSIAVNMKNEKGLKLVKELIAQVDVVVENYRPGVPARLGLDIDKLMKDNPRLIWAAISGFGQDSPWAKRPAYDMIVQSLSGVMSMTGEKNRPSVRLGIPAGDTVAGLYATIAINAALADRERSGKGRFIDVGMLDCQLAMLSYQSAYSLIAGVTPDHQGAGHDSIPTYRSFTGSDGREFVVTANTEKMWQGLCRSLNLEALMHDERFQDGKKRHEHREHLWPLLEEAFSKKSASVWVECLIDNDVPAALIKKVPEALNDARESGRGMILNMQNPQTGKNVEVVGNPIHFDKEPAPEASYPPALGTSAETVLKDWLGKGREEVKALFEEGCLSRAD